MANCASGAAAAAAGGGRGGDGRGLEWQRGKEEEERVAQDVKGKWQGGQEEEIMGERRGREGRDEKRSRVSHAAPSLCRQVRPTPAGSSAAQRLSRHLRLGASGESSPRRLLPSSSLSAQSHRRRSGRCLIKSASHWAGSGRLSGCNRNQFESFRLLQLQR